MKRKEGRKKEKKKKIKNRVTAATTPFRKSLSRNRKSWVVRVVAPLQPRRGGGEKKFKMFEEGVAAPSREVPAGVASLRNRFETRAGSVPRTFPPRAFLPFVRHLTTTMGPCAWIRRKKRSRAEQTQMLRSEPAGFSKPGEGRMDSDVCLPL